MTRQKRTTTTYNIPIEDKMEIEKLCIEVGYKTGVPIKWTDFMAELIKRYARDTAHDLIHEEKKS